MSTEDEVVDIVPILRLQNRSSTYSTENGVLDSNPERTLLASTHLLFTNYGPDSAVAYLRKNPRLLYDFSCFCGRARMPEDSRSHRYLLRSTGKAKSETNPTESSQKPRCDDQRSRSRSLTEAEDETRTLATGASNPSEHDLDNLPSSSRKALAPAGPIFAENVTLNNAYHETIIHELLDEGIDTDISKATEASFESEKDRQSHIADALVAETSSNNQLNLGSLEHADDVRQPQGMKRKRGGESEKRDESFPGLGLSPSRLELGKYPDLTAPSSNSGKGKGKAPALREQYDLDRIWKDFMRLPLDCSDSNTSTDDSAAECELPEFLKPFRQDTLEKPLPLLFPSKVSPRVGSSEPEITRTQYENLDNIHNDNVSTFKQECGGPSSDSNGRILALSPNNQAERCAERNPPDKTGRQSRAPVHHSADTDSLQIGKLGSKGEPSKSQQSVVKQVDYGSLLCALTTDIYNNVSSRPVQLSTSLSEMNQCRHDRYYSSRRYNTPHCPSNRPNSELLRQVPQDVFLEIIKYVSFNDFKNIRLVNKAFALQLSDTRFRSTVFNFGPEMFSHGSQNDPSTPKDGHLFHTYGEKIQKFGIAFEVDLNGLYSAQVKKNITVQDTFWGSYKWQEEHSPRYKQLNDLENLADDTENLGTAMGRLINVSELGLSLDSGLGWLAGADQSDMAIYKSRSQKSKIFKPRFTTDRNDSLAQGVLFESAQRKTAQCLNEQNQTDEYSRYHVQTLPSFADTDHGADYEDARHTGGVKAASPEIRTPDLVRGLTGDQQAQIAPLIFRYPGHPLVSHSSRGADMYFPPLYTYQPKHGLIPNAELNVPRLQPHIMEILLREAKADTAKRAASRKSTGEKSSRYPLIFNGVNLRAAAEGQRRAVQNQVYNPAKFPLKPNSLTEPQARWLLETAWAQRAFLISYVTSIVANKTILSPKVQSLHITKISSGLLKSLADNEFWAALPTMHTLTLLVVPDWRKEPVPKDESQRIGRLIPPFFASLKLKSFLEDFIAPLENVSNLTVGFASGGEYATGMFARNNHILPAPLTSNPKEWLVVRNQTLDSNASDSSSTIETQTMLTFEHIANLTLRNAWITPHMLRTFVKRHRDTSLKTLTLDSMSLTVKHAAQGVPLPARTSEQDFRPRFGKAAWLQERLPTTDCWPALLDSITPGKTFQEQKYEMGLIDSDALPESPEFQVEGEGAGGESSFRGNLNQIILKSCGYVRITAGVTTDEFNQSLLVGLQVERVDPGLHILRAALERHAMFLGEPTVHPTPDDDDDDDDNGDGDGDGGGDGGGNDIIISNNASSPPSMAVTIPAQHPGTTRSSSSSVPAPAPVPVPASPVLREPFPLMGRIVQAIHPVEKRVLECGFGMRFGWGRNMARWGAVEDGFLEGGTGRFSGVVGRDSGTGVRLDGEGGGGGNRMLGRGEWEGGEGSGVD